MKKILFVALAICSVAICLAADPYAGRDPAKTTLEEVKSALATAVEKGHPRLFVPDKDAFSRIRAGIATKPEWEFVKRCIIERAEALLKKPLVERSMEGFRMRGQHDISTRMLCWSAAYQLTLDRKYFEAAKKEIMSSLKWSDWNPYHYLDTAEMQLGIGVAYDWMYDLFTADERALIRKTIIEKGMIPATNGDKRTTWWNRCTSNWQQVCWDGVSTAALAICEDEPDWAAKIIHQAVTLLPLSTQCYSPAGAYPEGPGYWSYGTTRFVYFLAMMDAACGTTFGLFESKGFADTSEYLNHVTGPTGKTFNYSDGGESRGFQMANWWIAKKTGRYDVCQYDYDCFSKAFANRDAKKNPSRLSPGFHALYFFWADYPLPQAANRMPLDYASGGHCPLVTMRSSWGKNAAWVAAKGGRATYNHAHQDIGEFLYEVDGVRWVEDLGGQSYYSIEKLGMELWSMKQNADRWKVFRQCPRAHNVVTIDNNDFNVRGMATIPTTNFNAEKSSATIDLTEVYAKGDGIEQQAKSAKRTVSLDKASRALTVKDEFSGLKRGAKVRWAFITPADKAEVKGNSVKLSKGDKSITVDCNFPRQVKWEVTDLTKPVNSWDVSNKGHLLVSFTTTVMTSLDYEAEVIFHP